MNCVYYCLLWVANKFQCLEKFFLSSMKARQSPRDRYYYDVGYRPHTARTEKHTLDYQLSPRCILHTQPWLILWLPLFLLGDPKWEENHDLVKLEVRGLLGQETGREELLVLILPWLTFGCMATWRGKDPNRSILKQSWLPATMPTVHEDFKSTLTLFIE